MLVGPEGKAIFAAIAEKRSVYHAALQEKAVGNVQGARKFVDEDVKPRLDA